MGWFTELKLGWKLLILAGMLTAIGGTIFAGYTYINNKDKKIEQLEQNISTLQTNQAKIELSNTSLENERDRLLQQAQQNQQQLQQQLDLIKQAQDQITKYDQYLFSDSRKQEKLDEDKTDIEKALSGTNDQLACFWQNYSNMSGHCVDGKFVEGM